MKYLLTVGMFANMRKANRGSQTKENGCRKTERELTYFFGSTVQGNTYGRLRLLLLLFSQFLMHLVHHLRKGVAIDTTTACKVRTVFGKEQPMPRTPSLAENVTRDWGRGNPPTHSTA